MSEHELDELHLSAWRAFITSHARLIEQIDHDLIAANRLPLHWYDVLIELFEAPEQRLRLHELATRVVLSRSGLTRLVDRLEGAGLLYRQPDPTDRRGAFATLTEPGRAALRQAWPVYAKSIAHYFARHVSDEEAHRLVEILNRMLAAMRQTEA